VNPRGPRRDRAGDRQQRGDSEVGGGANGRVAPVISLGQIGQAGRAAGPVSGTADRYSYVFCRWFASANIRKTRLYCASARRRARSGVIAISDHMRITVTLR